MDLRRSYWNLVAEAQALLDLPRAKLAERRLTQGPMRGSDAGSERVLLEVMRWLCRAQDCIEVRGWGRCAGLLVAPRLGGVLSRNHWLHRSDVHRLRRAHRQFRVRGACSPDGRLAGVDPVTRRRLPGRQGRRQASRAGHIQHRPDPARAGGRRAALRRLPQCQCGERATGWSQRRTRTDAGVGFRLRSPRPARRSTRPTWRGACSRRRASSRAGAMPRRRSPTFAGRWLAASPTAGSIGAAWTAPTAPLTHTLGYALRGIIEAYRYTARAEYLAVARRTADGLLGAIRCRTAICRAGCAPIGRRMSSWVCLTGTAQIAHCLMLLGTVHADDERTRNARFAPMRSFVAPSMSTVARKCAAGSRDPSRSARPTVATSI